MLFILFLISIFLITINANQPKMICERSATAVSYGGVTLRKIHRDSKFAVPDKLRFNDYSYKNSTKVCEDFGLEIAEIKHQSDLEALQKYIAKHEQFSEPNYTFWIEGTDEKREGDWRNNNGDKLYHTAFWGFTPKGIQTTPKSDPTNNLQLHWKIDTNTKKQILVMMDVEKKNTFYKQKLFICQFLTGSRCYNSSIEEKEFITHQYSKDELGLIQVINNTEYYISNVQKNNEEAQSLCKLYNYEVIDLSITETEAESLISNISKKMYQEGLPNGVTAFWLGSTGIFLPDTMINWEWTNTKISNQWKDPIFSYNNKFRNGNHRIFGRCLVFGVLTTSTSQKIHLQFAPCDFRQWTICINKEKIKNRKKDRASILSKTPKTAFEIDCSSTEIEKKIPYPIPETSCRDYFRCVEVFPNGIKFFRYKCPPKNLFDPVSQKCVKESHPVDKKLCEIYKNSTYPIPTTDHYISTSGVMETTPITIEQTIGTETTYSKQPTTSALFSSTVEIIPKTSEKEEIITSSTLNPTNIVSSTTNYHSSTTDEDGLETDTSDTLTTEIEGSTTPFPYFPIDCDPGNSYKIEKKNLIITKLASNSKSLYIDYRRYIENGYLYAETECKNWGLELLIVKTPVELDVIREYFGTENSESIKENVTFWISGSDYMNGNWTYTAGDERIFYQAFWGITSLGFQTKDSDNLQSNRIQLHWGGNLKEDPFLVMMDVEGEGNFYKKTGIICQYLSSTDCHKESEEEEEFNHLMTKSNFTVKLGQLPDSKLMMFLNPVQKTAIDAVNFCKSKQMMLLNLALSKRDNLELFEKLWFFKGKHTGFWVGQTNIFQYQSELQWDWIKNIMLDPKKDPILKDRKGKNQYTGHCLGFTLVNYKPKVFYLQASPCVLPQYTVCLK